MNLIQGYLILILVSPFGISCSKDNPSDSIQQRESQSPSLSSINRMAILASRADEYISVVDIEAAKEVGVIHIGKPIYRCAVRPFDNSIWFTVLYDGVYYIDAHTNEIQSTSLPVVGGDVVFNYNGNRVFVARQFLVSADPDRLNQHETIPQPESFSFSTMNIDANGHLAILGIPNIGEQNSDGTINVVSKPDLAKWLILKEGESQIQMTNAVIGFPQKPPVILKDGNLIVSLNVLENHISIYDKEMDLAEFFPAPVQYSEARSSLLGFDSQNSRFYVLISYYDPDKNSEAFRDVADIAIFDVNSKSFVEVQTLPWLYQGGKFDPISKHLLLPGPLPISPTNSTLRQTGSLTVYDPQSKEIIKTINIDSKITAGASVILNTFTP